MVWRPRPSSGGRVGIALASAAAVLACLALALGLTSEPGPFAFVELVVAIVALAAWAIFALWTYGFSTLRYTLTPNALVIRWLGGDDIIPLERVDGIYSGQRIGPVRGVRGLTWPGYVVGFKVQNGMPVSFFATTEDPAALTLIVLDQRIYAISPDDGPAFRQELIRRIEQATSTLPTPRQGMLRRVAATLMDPASLLLLGISLALALAVLGLYMLRIASLPAETALHFAADGTPDVTGPLANLARLPLLGLAGWLGSTLVGLGLARSDRALARLLWFGSAAAELVLVIAALRLLT